MTNYDNIQTTAPIDTVAYDLSKSESACKFCAYQKNCKNNCVVGIKKWLGRKKR